MANALPCNANSKRKEKEKEKEKEEEEEEEEANAGILCFFLFCFLCECSLDCFIQFALDTRVHSFICIFCVDFMVKLVMNLFNL